MSARLRAGAFAAGALVCALLAAAAGGGGTAPGIDPGELRDVAVATRDVPRGERIAPGAVRDAFTVARVPARFAPPDALPEAAAAVGSRLAIDLPSGSYLTASSLRADAARAGALRTPGRGPAGTTPVEVSVAAAGGLAGSAGTDASVDVVAAGALAPGPGGGGVRVVARRVPLLALRQLEAEPGAGERWGATLALKRPQALAVIRAESAGRTIRLLAR